MPLADKQILKLAGDAAYRRGLAYFSEGRVRLLRSTEATFTAEVEGSETYRLELKCAGEGYEFNCECPAADDGSFCKHLVAASLAWREGEREPVPVRDELMDFLKTQPAERLAEWLRELADEDPDIEKRLKLLASQNDPEQLKKSLGTMLNASGLHDWRRSNDYARKLDAPLRLLAALLGSDPAQCLALCEYALGRLWRIYENSDDSSGAIGGRMQDFADLYWKATAAAGIDGAALAKSLHKLQQRDDWGLFPLENYWKALGEEGQAQYRKLVEADYEKLPAARASGTSSRWSEEFGPRSRMEKLARVRRDFESLSRVLTHDLSGGYAYQQMVRACREFGREREALQWAERGVKAHPGFRGMRELLAEELERSGLKEEVLQVVWQIFLSHPAEQEWSRLKAAAGKEWPGYRARALDHVQKQERRAEDGRPDVTARLNLLIADGDLETARRLAQSSGAHPGALERLAGKLEATHPEDAGLFLRRAVQFELPRVQPPHYAEIAGKIVRVVKLAPGAATQEWIAGIKTQYRSRRKLMALLAEV